MNKPFCSINLVLIRPCFPIRQIQQITIFDLFFGLEFDCKWFIFILCMTSSAKVILKLANKFTVSSVNVFGYQTFTVGLSSTHKLLTTAMLRAYLMLTCLYVFLCDFPLMEDKSALRAYRVLSVCDHRTRLLSDSAAEADEFPSNDRMEKTRTSELMRQFCFLRSGIEITPLC